MSITNPITTPSSSNSNSGPLTLSNRSKINTDDPNSTYTKIATALYKQVTTRIF